MNGIDSTHLAPEKVKSLADILCEDSAAHWQHVKVEEIHPSGEALLDRMFYRAMPIRTTSHSRTEQTKVAEQADGMVKEDSFQLKICDKVAVKDKHPELSAMQERAKVLASALKAMEK